MDHQFLAEIAAPQIVLDGILKMIPTVKHGLQLSWPQKLLVVGWVLISIGVTQLK
jgi:hypothetical protein